MGCEIKNTNIKNLFLIGLIFFCCLLPPVSADNKNISSINISPVIHTIDAETGVDINRDYVPGRMIVKLNTDALPVESFKGIEDSLETGTGTKVITNYSALGVDGLLIVNTSGTSVSDSIQNYENSPYVSYAEPDYIINIPKNENVSGFILKDEVKKNIPNDPSFGYLWGMYNTGQSGGTAGTDIDAPDAWNISTGSSDVIIAVVDTGVDYTHEDLSSNMWINTGEIPDNGIDDDGNGYIDDYHGWDFYNNDTDPMDDNSHGTHCSGIIAGIGNNSIGVSGVNWNAKIMPLKFIGAGGSGPTSGAISAILYANKMGAKVISNSWGGNGYSQSLKDVIDASPAVVVCAAGNNNGNDNDLNPNYPSGYNSSNIIAVASIDRYNNISSFSNYGFTSVDLGAPGSSIYSTILNNSYGYKSGTSMATPHVSGIAGLVYSLYPNMTSGEVINRIMNSTDPVPALQNKTVTGGRINAYNSIKPIENLPVANFSANPTSGTIPLTVQFTDLSTGLPTNWSWSFGDNGSSTLKNPAYTYTKTGNFTVNLTVDNPTGSDTKSSKDYIRLVNPVMTHNITAAADTYTIIYPHGTGSYNEGATQTYLTQAKPGSDLLNITVDNTLNPATGNWTFTNITEDHNISTTGRYTPGQIHILFTTNQTYGQAPLLIRFTDHSVGDPLSFYWQFGDGSTSNEQNPVHVYQTPGIYTVTLRAINNQSGGVGVLNNGVTVTG